MSWLRITGGVWRSRRVHVAAVAGLRPTPDRVRETLFNWLGQDLTGLVCLDLFAGSGILGFEAASRGARQVTLVENNRRTLQRLLENSARLDVSGVCQVIAGDALTFAAAVRGGSQAIPYDLLFLDPPYRGGWLERVTPHLAALAHPSMRIYAEAERRLEALGEWRTTKCGQAGQVHYHLLEKP